MRSALVGSTLFAVAAWGVASPPVLASGSNASWSKSQSAAPAAGGSGGGDGNGLAIAPSGRAIITGWFQNTVYFPKSADDSFALTSLAGDDVFVAEWDPTTNYFTRVQRAGGSASANAYGAAIAGSDAVITGVVGTGTLYFPRSASADDSIALSTAAGTNTFVARWNPSTGYFVWAQAISGSLGSMIYPQSVASTGASDAPLVSGYATTSPIYFPTGPGDDSIALSFTNMSGFVAQMRSADDSRFAWAQAISSYGGAHYVLGDSAAARGSNAPVVTGSFMGSALFPTGPATSIVLTDLDDTESVFLAAMTGDDSYFAWAQRIRSVGDSSIVESGSVSMSSTGAPVVSGQFGGTVYLPKGPGDDSIALSASGRRDAFVAATASADDSYFSWALRVKGSPGGVVRSLSVDVDGTGQPVISGDFTGTAAFPTGSGADITLTGDDTPAVYVAGVKSDGSGFSWAVKAGGTGDAVSTTVATGAPGTVMTTGYFGGQVTFANVMTAKGATTYSPDPQRNPFVASITVGSTPPPTPGPAYPPSPPRDVTAAAGDGTAKVSWSAPSSSGSYPITNYSVTSSPAGGSCMVAAPALECEVTGLKGGTAYTFTVRALNGAGWSPSSEPSNEVTPPAPVSILITGSRQGGKVVIAGTSRGLGMGAMLHPWTRKGDGEFKEGVSTILVSATGTFSWERKVRGAISVYVQTPDGSAKSNTVVIRRA